MRHLSVILCLLIVTVKAQSVDGSLLQIQIVNDSLQTFADNPKVTISLSCKNNGNTDLLLYGLDNLLTTGVREDILKDPERVSASFALFIFNEKHERVYGVWSMPDSIAYKPMPREKLEARMEKNRLEYISKKKVLTGNSTLNFDKKIDLHEFPLKNGTYYLQLIYFSGKRLMTKLVGEAQIEQDKKTHNADLFQGYATTNQITFRVD